MGFQVSNRTNQPLWVCVLFTFGEHIYQKGGCNIGPNESRILDDGAFILRKYWLFIHDQAGHYLCGQPETGYDWKAEGTTASYCTDPPNVLLWAFTDSIIAAALNGSPADFTPLEQRFTTHVSDPATFILPWGLTDTAGFDVGIYGDKAFRYTRWD